MNALKSFKQTIKISIFVAAILVGTLMLNNPTYASSISVGDLHNLANAQRSGAGLAVLNLNSQLNSAAYAKANHMIANNYWAHISPSGVSPWYFIGASGYSYTSAGENLAKDFSTSSGVISGWMNSPTHRENVMGAYADVGYAVVDGVLLGSNTTLVVAMYGTQAAAPAPAPVVVAQTQPTPQAPPAPIVSSPPVQEVVAEVVSPAVVAEPEQVVVDSAPAPTPAPNTAVQVAAIVKEDVTKNPGEVASLNIIAKAPYGSFIDRIMGTILPISILISALAVGFVSIKIRQIIKNYREFITYRS